VGGLVATTHRAQALALRRRIVLAASDGLKNTEIAQRLAVDATAQGGATGLRLIVLDGLIDEPRPGRPRAVTEAQVEAVIVNTLQFTPKDATHCSTRSMAVEVGLTQTAVHRGWRALGLAPSPGRLKAHQRSAVRRQGP
jgi:transposase